MEASSHYFKEDNFRIKLCCFEVQLILRNVSSRVNTKWYLSTLLALSKQEYHLECYLSVEPLLELLVFHCLLCDHAEPVFEGELGKDEVDPLWIVLKLLLRMILFSHIISKDIQLHLDIPLVILNIPDLFLLVKAHNLEHLISILNLLTWSQESRIVLRLALGLSKGGHGKRAHRRFDDYFWDWGVQGSRDWRFEDE